MRLVDGWRWLWTVTNSGALVLVCYSSIEVRVERSRRRPPYCRGHRRNSQRLLRPLLMSRAEKPGVLKAACCRFSNVAPATENLHCHSHLWCVVNEVLNRCSARNELFITAFMTDEIYFSCQPDPTLRSISPWVARSLTRPTLDGHSVTDTWRRVCCATGRINVTYFQVTENLCDNGIRNAGRNRRGSECFK